MLRSLAFRGAILASLWIVSPLPLRAQEPRSSAAGLTPQAAARAALEANPDLAAAHAAIEAARGRLVQTGRWPNPELALAVRDDFAARDEGERGFSADFEQRLPVAGRLARAHDVGRVDVALAIAEAREFERTLVGEVQRTLYGVLTLDEALRSREAVLGTLRELAASTARRLQAAEVSEVEVSLLEIELARLEQEQRLLRLERTTLALRLNQLLNRAPMAPVAASGPLDATALDPDRAGDDAAHALARRPDVARVRLEVDRARAEAELARAEAWEDWTLGVGYENDRQVFDGEPSVDPIGVKRDAFLGLSVRVPLPLWNRNQGRIAEARADERRAQAQVAAAERRAEVEIATARQRVEEFARIARAYDDDLRARSRRTIALLEKGYRQGLVPITALIQSEQQLADTELRRTQTLGQLREAEIELETALASSSLLDRPELRQEVRP